MLDKGSIDLGSRGSGHGRALGAAGLAWLLEVFGVAAVIIAVIDAL